MGPGNIPVLLLIAGQNKDEGKELLINLNQVRMIETKADQINLIFSEHHTFNLYGNAVSDVLAFLGEHCIMTNGMPFSEAKRLRSQLQASGPAPDPPPES
jgi:hypothetical protein